MKLKFPKKITICSYTFSVKYCKDKEGGTFNFSEREITIGTKENDEDRIFMVICHEIMEIIHCISSTRYNDYSCNTNYKFFQDHKEFENNINIFADVIKNFII